MDVQRYLTVKALTKYIKRKFDADPHLTNVLVKGEISNFKMHSSGHMYFTLKDDQARMLAVMFSSANRSLKFRPENGMQVLINGDVTVYEAGGQYQMYVKSMQPDGIGDLYLAFEQLKKRLEKEGLFDIDKKRPLPVYPKVVGIVTSPTGAAVRDIMTTIKRRYPVAQMLVYPALVQGENAAPSIVSAIEKANDDGRADVLIVGRGGGSIEELWAFNEEQVALAIRASQIPVISAVGHETDITIADFAADMRAPTPTGGAELAVPHIEEVVEKIAARKMRLIRAMSEQIRRERKRYETVKHSYIMRNPETLYRQQAERLDRLTEKLRKERALYFKQAYTQVNEWTSRLERSHPGKKIRESAIEVDRLKMDLIRQMQSVFNRKEAEFKRRVSLLHALSPLKVMERGYSLTYTADNQLVKSTKDAKVGNELRVRLSDGSLYCQIQSVEENQSEE
ncbi:exodeoxyribonuclease VII large subunit [Bacillus sp. REN10]|uniref:exodeoxyribonuclease VII large subunit n=1 Tax=Bacillus sp. REN10 TaxID=2782541 RepID=UPI00193BCACE|nr:exodeoxyribonuclease VII large subunit [Bacillus sp. REN10]